MVVQSTVPEDFHVLPSPALEHAAQRCPLLETDKAKGEWVECCTRRFLPIATRIAGNDDLAMDALQISWIKVLEAVNVCLVGPVACPWVTAIVANTAKDLVRRRGRRREVPFDPSKSARRAVPGPDAAIEERQSLELMREIIAMLPSTLRSATCDSPESRPGAFAFTHGHRELNQSEKNASARVRPCGLP